VIETKTKKRNKLKTEEMLHKSPSIQDGLRNGIAKERCAIVSEVLLTLFTVCDTHIATV